jgi:glycopeptide antibiotics resistance protein
MLGALAGSALAVAITLTLFRGGFGHESLARLRTCAVTDPLVLSADGLANLALFAPTAFLAVLAIGRPWLVSLGVAVVSLAVEALQALEWIGVCDSSDAVHNTAGGLAAALAAAAVRAVWFRRYPAVSGSGACPRSC